MDFLKDRSEVAARLREGHAALAVLLDGVPDEVYARKPDGGWSVAEIVEHLIAVEGRVLAAVRRSIAKGAGGPANPMSDETVWRRALGETGKGEAPPVVVPRGEWADRGAAMAELASRRRATIDYALTTEDPLRACAVPMPLGEVDGYQCLIMLAGHLERHTRQIQALL